MAQLTHSSQAALRLVNLETGRGAVSVDPWFMDDVISPVCRVCGCTNLDCRRCIERTGVPCFWVENDLCSACYEADDGVMGFLLPEDDKAIDQAWQHYRAAADGRLFDSRAWTGERAERLVWIRRRLHWWIHDLLWPSYPCEQCVGQEPQQGCYCAYHGAVAPCGPGPGLVRRLGREIFDWWHGKGRSW